MAIGRAASEKLKKTVLSATDGQAKARQAVVKPGKAAPQVAAKVGRAASATGVLAGGKNSFSVDTNSGNARRLTAQSVGVGGFRASGFSKVLPEQMRLTALKRGLVQAAQSGDTATVKALVEENPKLAGVAVRQLADESFGNSAMKLNGRYETVRGSNIEEVANV